MPMDGWMLGTVAKELGQMLGGARIEKVAQPEADELVVHVHGSKGNHKLLLSASSSHARVHLTTQARQSPLEAPLFCMLLRKHLQGGRIVDIRQIAGDRILEIDVENTDELFDRTSRTLIIEVMGRHSNIMLTDGSGKIIDAIKRVDSQISRVREVLPGLMYQRPPMQEKLDPNTIAPDALKALLPPQGELDKALQAAIQGLAPATARELARRAVCEDARVELMRAGDCERICQTLRSWRDEPKPCVLYDGLKTVDVFGFDVDWVGDKQRFQTISQALEAYFGARDTQDRIRQKSASLQRVIKNNIERCEKKLALQLEALLESQKMEQYRIYGDLLTANLYRIKPNTKSVKLENFYDENNADIIIPLDERLVGVENAQRYYRLYQKLKAGRETAAEQKEKTEEELLYFRQQQDNLARCTQEADITEIRDELVQEGFVRASHNRKTAKKLTPSQPMRFISSRGIEISVGKNNRQNDALVAAAKGDYLWLHVKDMPGSHVLVHETIDAVDEMTLLEAANLAAFYSSARTSAQVPVDYTARRYVKKPSGAKPGMVIYTNQHTLFITPDEGKAQALAGKKA